MSGQLVASRRGGDDWARRPLARGFVLPWVARRLRRDLRLCRLGSDCCIAFTSLDAASPEVLSTLPARSRTKAAPSNLQGRILFSYLAFSADVFAESVLCDVIVMWRPRHHAEYASVVALTSTLVWAVTVAVEQWLTTATQCIPIWSGK
ncbi:hypothetical protein LSAT2_026665, partial [Lamellibrachia satsuma]